MTQDGQKVIQLSLPTSGTWRDKSSGETRERTEWHRVVNFIERLGDVAGKHLHKGSKVYIEGTLLSGLPPHFRFKGYRSIPKSKLSLFPKREHWADRL